MSNWFEENSVYRCQIKFFVIVSFFIAVRLLIAPASFAQTIITQNTFDLYSTGTNIAQGGGAASGSLTASGTDTWGLLATVDNGYIFIDNSNSASGSNSLRIDDWWFNTEQVDFNQVDVSDYVDVQFSIKYASGDLPSSDAKLRLLVEYYNGWSWVSAVNDISLLNQSQDNASYSTYTTAIGVIPDEATSVRVTVSAISTSGGGTDVWFIDDVQLEGTLDNLIVDPCDAAASGNLDTDGDNVSDICDLDDDNDGILDIHEGNCIINETFEGFSALGSDPKDYYLSDYYQVYNTSPDLTPISSPDFVTEGNVGSGSQWFAPIEGGAFVVLNSRNDDAVFTTTLTKDNDGIFIEYSAAEIADLGLLVGDVLNFQFKYAPGHNYDAGNNLRDSDANTNLKVWFLSTGSGQSLPSPTAGGATVNVPPNDVIFPGAWNPLGNDGTADVMDPNSWKEYYTEIIYNGGDLQVAILAGTGGEVSTNENLFVDEFVICIERDTDNDSIPDYLDTDSDGDGCPDAIEGSASLTNSDINGSDMIAGSVDSDGVPSALTAPQGLGSAQNASVQDSECVCSNMTLDVSKSNDLDCLNNSFELGAVSNHTIIDWTWIGPGGWSSIVNPTFSEVGRYYVTATSDLGCVMMDSIDVTKFDTGFNTKATVSSYFSPEIDTVTLLVTTDLISPDYIWTGPNGFSSTKQYPIAVDTGMYSVDVVDGSCGASADVHVGLVLREICNNGKDDDNDGLIDCDDDDCYYVPGCGEPIVHSDPTIAPYASKMWAYGNNLFLNFSKSLSVDVSQNQMANSEGVTSMTDLNGNILFYSDGGTVWNGDHEVMENGSGLLGGIESLNATIAFQDPQYDSKFYLFVANNENNPNNTVTYSIIDLAANNGKGIVARKNMTIRGNTEGLTAIPHANGRDFWVITTELNTSKVFVTSISQNAEMTTDSFNLPMAGGLNFTNEMNIIADGTGKRLAIGRRSHEKINLYDFNNATGQLSDLIELPIEEDVYGMEFSPNSQYLYVGTIDDQSLFQLDIQPLHTSLTIDDVPTILNSRKDLDLSRSNSWGQLQIGPDGRIYAASLVGKLASVDSPNEEGQKAGWENDVFSNFDNFWNEILQLLWEYSMDLFWGAFSDDNQRMSTNLFSSNERRAGTSGLPNCVNGGCFRSSYLLPVELSIFEVEKIQSGAKLNWETESELNNEKFEIERSIDGVVFEKIGTIRGNGTANSVNTYSFEDLNLPASNIIYYRLKQIDFDGMFEYSKIEHVTVNNHSAIGASELSIFPNPAKMDLTIFGLKNGESSVVQIFNELGKQVFLDGEMEVSSSYVAFNVSSLDKGMYFVKIKENQGSIKSVSFIKD